MPEGVAVVSKDQWEIGNQMGVLPQDYLETLEWLSDELENEFQDPAARIPIDKKNADVVYAINPREIKYDPHHLGRGPDLLPGGRNGPWPATAGT